jgi:uncharacterized membrane protein
MAKQTFLKLAVVIVLTMAASATVHAATTIVTTSIGGSSFNPSMKVSCYYNSDGTSSSFNGTGYGIACGHYSGDKVIAAKSSDSTLYFKTSVNSAAAFSANADSALSTTGWTSM